MSHKGSSRHEFGNSGLGKGTIPMPFLIWKEENDFHGWGCADCGFVLQKPQIGQSLGEYVATIRNQFDEHDCEMEILELRQRQERRRLWLIKKAANSR